MATTRRRTLLVFMAGWCGAAVLAAPPVAADVDCQDLRTRAAAQSYLEGRPGDPDRLDSDLDGRACEGNDPATHGNWALLALGVLMAGGLLRFAVDEDRQRRRRTSTAPVEELVPVAVPRLELAADEVTTFRVQKSVLVADASNGSLRELARALRLVPYAERMSVLEEHARSHGTPPKQVLDALAAQIDDLELQGWALAGYDPPWTVRPRYCSCVGGLRNHRLQTAPDGTHYWSCATCNRPDRQVSKRDGGSTDRVT